MELNRETALNKKDQASPKTSGNPEVEIRKICNEIMTAMEERDVEKVMSFYAPDIVAFDLAGPAQFIGKKDYKKTWVEAFEMCADTEKSFHNVVHDLKITANENLAFVHSIRHNFMTPKVGKKMEIWMRCTQCFEKLNNKWLITHEQFSFPVDFETGKALMNQKPVGVTNLH